MNFVYFISFALAFLLSFVGTFLVARFALRKNIVDVPDSERRLHKHAVPTMGGLAVFVSFVLVTFTVGVLLCYLLNCNIPFKILAAIWTGGAVLMIGGYLDDKYRLKHQYLVIFPVIAALIMVSSGISAVSIHNPLTGGIIMLDQLASGFVVFAWILVMIFTTKVLDGMDGLTTGVSAIASLVLFGMSLTPQVLQPQTALL